MTIFASLLAMDKVAAPHGCRLNPALRAAIEQYEQGGLYDVAEPRDGDDTDVRSIPVRFAQETHNAQS